MVYCREERLQGRVDSSHHLRCLTGKARFWGLGNGHWEHWRDCGLPASGSVIAREVVRPRLFYMWGA